MVVLLACVAVAVMAGQLRPTNEESFTHPNLRDATFVPTPFPTAPTTSSSVP
jgi:hypothetical protein